MNDKNNNINILFTSVGRRSYLVEYFKTAINGHGMIHVSNSNGDTPAFKAADKCVISPMIYSNDYIDFLTDYCRKNKIDCIISLFDADLPVLAKNKSKFEILGTRVLVSDEKVIRICNDKYSSYQYLKDKGFNVPDTFLNLEDVKSALNKGKVAFPLIVKPRWGMGSIGIFEVDNLDELDILYNKLNKDINKTYLRYESQNDDNNKIIIQEKLTGTEYGLDIINDLEGKYKVTSCKIKYGMRAGETDCAMTIKNNALTELGKKISGSLRHIGNLDVDIIEMDGRFFVLEMNARFGGGYPFSHIGGVNLPLAIISWLKGEKEPVECFNLRYNVKGHKDIRIVEL